MGWVAALFARNQDSNIIVARTKVRATMIFEER